MSQNFAPYQDDSPEIERAFSPPPPNHRARPSTDSSRARSPPLRPQGITRNISEVQSQSQYLPPPDSFASTTNNNNNNTNTNANTNDGWNHSQEERARSLEAFQTSLPMRLDYEAMLAYLLLPPAGGVFLLLVEHKSDYVRFHAWQSSMLFAAMFVVHLLLSWSAVLSWLLFVLDLGLVVFLALHAYRDAEALEHYEVPFFGRIANRFVDSE